MTVGSKKYNLPTEQENSNLIPLRHSTAHVMAMAVQSLYPDGKVTIGPCIQHGYVLIILFSEHLSSTTGSIMISISRRESSLRVI
jgi:threonyl-tRNA synthetase